MKMLCYSRDRSSINCRSEVDGESQEAQLKHDPGFLDTRPVHRILRENIKFSVEQNDNAEHTSGSLGQCHVTNMESVPFSFTGFGKLKSPEASSEDSRSPEPLAFRSRLTYTPLLA